MEINILYFIYFYIKLSCFSNPFLKVRNTVWGEVDCNMDRKGKERMAGNLSSFLEVQIRKVASYNIYFSFPKYSRNWSFLFVNVPKAVCEGRWPHTPWTQPFFVLGSFLNNEIKIALCFWSHIFIFIPMRSCVKGMFPVFLFTRAQVPYIDFLV